MEGDGTVAAAAHALGHGVVDILLVPEVVRHVARNQVMLWYEGKESASAQRVSEHENFRVINSFILSTDNERMQHCQHEQH